LINISKTNRILHQDATLESAFRIGRLQRWPYNWGSKIPTYMSFPTWKALQGSVVTGQFRFRGLDLVYGGRF